MSDPDIAFLWRLLVEALTALAADPAEQCAWSDRYGVPPDELALGFDDAYRLVPQLAAAGRLDADAVAELRALDALFTGLTDEGDPARWAVAALADDPAWARARAVSRRLLVEWVGDRRPPMPVIRVIR
ncbi:hypothetical protein [Embleya hyalina]|uniref:Uncharacterized protein n=1 Tax=Embleya hyalina TaxID=516124 RepID=A0A401YJW9_9ACTN|nr:hypothetical protein [Embleya hyalina]GCD94910.1 hypothetical protein EHYA_02579 [Embleya hyalina]